VAGNPDQHTPERGASRAGGGTCWPGADFAAAPCEKGDTDQRPENAFPESGKE